MRLSVLARIVKLDFDALGRPASLKLLTRLLGWARQRNRIARASVLARPPDKASDESPASLHALQAECSATGVLLIRDLTNWDRMQRSAHRRKHG